MTGTEDEDYEDASGTGATNKVYTYNLSITINLLSYHQFN
jgi:hypothetical protein